MRKVNFKVRNIGSEKYLSYVLDDETDLDEELLDYLDDNKIAELIDIIYEEDDENDYLTYNITDRTTVGALLSGTVHAEMMLGIIRGVASGIMNMRDLGIPVSYVILNKDFTYVNPVTFDVKMICIPVGSDVAANAEFKAFVKGLILNATYADDEDCNYVAKLINMLNVEKFTIRGFVSQITELMEAAGLQVEEEFMDVGDSGVEVSQGVDIPQGDTSLDDLPEGFEKPADRTKPWGTGQAVLAAKAVLNEPFMVINADDYYGKEAYVKVHDYLIQEQPDDGILHICMAGFRLGNTLSDNGSVTRGVCHIEEGALTGVTETHNIFKTADGAEARNDDKVEKLDVKSLVSMNMWGLTPVFMDTLEKGFVDFLSEIKEGDIKKEYLLPEMIDCLIKEGKAKVDVLETKDTWFGVTYQEDKAAVTEAFANLVKSGVYPSNLYK